MTITTTTEAQLMALQSVGFVLRIPGGSSRKEYHSSYGIMYRYREETIEVLIVPYNPNIFIARKMDEEIFDEEPKGTLELKVSEQTGVIIREYVEIGCQIAKNNKSHVPIEEHIKYVFSSDSFDDSNIRTVSSPDKRLDPPKWVELELLKRYLFSGHLWMVELFETTVLGPREKKL